MIAQESIHFYQLCVIMAEFANYAGKCECVCLWKAQLYRDTMCLRSLVHTETCLDMPKTESSHPLMILYA